MQFSTEGLEMGTVHELFPGKRPQPPMPNDDEVDQAIGVELLKLVHPEDASTPQFAEFLYAFTQDLSSADMEFFTYPNQIDVQAIGERIDEMRAHIFQAMRFSESSPSLLLQLGQLWYQPLQGFIPSVVHTNRMQWTANCAYYGAVVLVYEDRIKRFRSLVDA